MGTSPVTTASRVGQRIQAIRRGRRLTQQELSRRTGLAGPFLSRVENGRAVPSVVTLERLAAGMEISVGDLLGSKPGGFQTPCPVSHSGRCIAELIHQPSRRATPMGEHYTAGQIRLLRLANYLVQCADAKTLSALGTIMRAFARLPSDRRDPKWLHAISGDEGLTGG